MNQMGWYTDYSIEFRPYEHIDQKEFLKKLGETFSECTVEIKDNIWELSFREKYGHGNILIHIIREINKIIPKKQRFHILGYAYPESYLFSGPYRVRYDPFTNKIYKLKVTNPYT